jgi:hypothetical protein
MNDSEASLLRQCDGEMGLGDGVHRGAEDRDVQGDFAGYFCASVRLVGQDAAAGWLEKNVVEG